MVRARSGRILAALALAGMVAGCGLGDRHSGGLSLSFEDRPEPEVFTLEGVGRRDAAGGAGGFWAVVGGLARPERARVENLATGERVIVALFAGGLGGEVRLSVSAAEALDIGAEPARVRVTALRRAPVLDVE